ncbi:MAG: hypothetical protein EBT65_06340 [Actinobacteria bacterium]|nr:hypothetical protein [Actinomycetota bacterium]
MALKFIDPISGEQIGSTSLGRAVLSAAMSNLDSSLSNSLSNQPDWRKTYQSAFACVAQAEFSSSTSMLEVATQGLIEFESRVVTESGELLVDAVRNAWRLSKDLVATVVIKGSGEKLIPKVCGTETLEQMTQKHMAESGIIAAINDLDKSRVDEDLLIALAGGAEYSPSRPWLDWGGSVAIVARPRVELWQELISRARYSAGTLYVPVLKSKLKGADSQTLDDDELARIAGLDLVNDFEAASGWLATLARTETRRLVLGSYAYAPGAKHIEAQAVQHCLGRVMTESLPKSRVVLTWLATPTDSHVVPVEFAEDIKSRFASRSLLTKFRDFFYGARENKPTLFTNANGIALALIDPSSSVQGSSYALAKRVQRWMAYQQQAADRKVIYLVSPPAYTDSVLSYRILRASYHGAPHFGLFPYKTDVAISLATCLLLSELSSPIAVDKSNPTAIFSRLAVHAGLWRSIYKPSDLWRISTVRGILGYFKKA